MKISTIPFVYKIPPIAVLQNHPLALPLPPSLTVAMAEIKKGRGRKGLKALTANDVNISAGKVSSSPIPPSAEDEKESRDSLVSIVSPQKAKKIVSKSKARATTKKDFADELQELQGRLELL